MDYQDIFKSSDPHKVLMAIIQLRDEIKEQGHNDDGWIHEANSTLIRLKLYYEELLSQEEEREPSHDKDYFLDRD